MKLPVCLVRHEYRPRESLLHQVFDGPRMVPVRMGNEKVLCLVNLLRGNIGRPVETIGGCTDIQNKGMTVPFHIKTVSPFIAAPAGYIQLHSHISIILKYIPIFTNKKSRPAIGTASLHVSVLFFLLYNFQKPL